MYTVHRKLDVTEHQRLSGAWTRKYEFIETGSGMRSFPHFYTQTSEKRQYGNCENAFDDESWHQTQCEVDSAWMNSLRSYPEAQHSCPWVSPEPDPPYDEGETPKSIKVPRFPPREVFAKPDPLAQFGRPAIGSELDRALTQNSDAKRPPSATSSVHETRGGWASQFSPPSSRPASAEIQRSTNKPPRQTGSRRRSSGINGQRYPDYGSSGESHDEWASSPSSRKTWENPGPSSFGSGWKSRSSVQSPFGSHQSKVLSEYPRSEVEDGNTLESAGCDLRDSNQSILSSPTSYKQDYNQDYLESLSEKLNKTAKDFLDLIGLFEEPEALLHDPLFPEMPEEVREAIRSCVDRFSSSQEDQQGNNLQEQGPQRNLKHLPVGSHKTPSGYHSRGKEGALGRSGQGPDPDVLRSRLLLASSNRVKSAASEVSRRMSDLSTMESTPLDSTTLDKSVSHQELSHIEAPPESLDQGKTTTITSERRLSKEETEDAFFDECASRGEVISRSLDLSDPSLNSSIVSRSLEKSKETERKSSIAATPSEGRKSPVPSELSAIPSTGHGKRPRSKPAEASPTPRHDGNTQQTQKKQNTTLPTLAPKGRRSRDEGESKVSDHQGSKYETSRNRRDNDPKMSTMQSSTRKNSKSPKKPPKRVSYVLVEKELQNKMLKKPNLDQLRSFRRAEHKKRMKPDANPATKDTRDSPSKTTRMSMSFDGSQSQQSTHPDTLRASRPQIRTYLQSYILKSGVKLPIYDGYLQQYYIKRLEEKMAKALNEPDRDLFLSSSVPKVLGEKRPSFNVPKRRFGSSEHQSFVDSCPATTDSTLSQTSSMVPSYRQQIAQSESEKLSECNLGTPSKELNDVITPPSESFITELNNTRFHRCGEQSLTDTHEPIGELLIQYTELKNYIDTVFQNLVPRDLSSRLRSQSTTTTIKGNPSGPESYQIASGVNTSMLGKADDTSDGGAISTSTEPGRLSSNQTLISCKTEESGDGESQVERPLMLDSIEQTSTYQRDGTTSQQQQGPLSPDSTENQSTSSQNTKLLIDQPQRQSRSSLTRKVKRNWNPSIITIPVKPRRSSAIVAPSWKSSATSKRRSLSTETQKSPDKSLPGRIQRSDIPNPASATSTSTSSLEVSAGTQVTPKGCSAFESQRFDEASMSAASTFLTNKSGVASGAPPPKPATVEIFQTPKSHAPNRRRSSLNELKGVADQGSASSDPSTALKNTSRRRSTGEVSVSVGETQTPENILSILKLLKSTPFFTTTVTTTTTTTTTTEEHTVVSDTKSDIVTDSSSDVQSVSNNLSTFKETTSTQVSEETTTTTVVVSTESVGLTDVSDPEATTSFGKGVFILDADSPLATLTLTQIPTTAEGSSKQAPIPPSAVDSESVPPMARNEGAYAVSDPAHMQFSRRPSLPSSLNATDHTWVRRRTSMPTIALESFLTNKNNAGTVVEGEDFVEVSEEREFFERTSFHSTEELVETSASESSGLQVVNNTSTGALPELDLAGSQLQVSPASSTGMTKANPTVKLNEAFVEISEQHEFFERTSFHNSEELVAPSASDLSGLQGVSSSNTGALATLDLVDTEVAFETSPYKSLVGGRSSLSRMDSETIDSSLTNGSRRMSTGQAESPDQKRLSNTGSETAEISPTDRSRRRSIGEAKLPGQALLPNRDVESIDSSIKLQNYKFRRKSTDDAQLSTRTPYERKSWFDWRIIRTAAPDASSELSGSNDPVASTGEAQVSTETETTLNRGTNSSSSETLGDSSYTMSEMTSADASEVGTSVTSDSGVHMGTPLLTATMDTTTSEREESAVPLNVPASVSRRFDPLDSGTFTGSSPQSPVDPSQRPEHTFGYDTTPSPSQSGSDLVTPAIAAGSSVASRSNPAESSNNDAFGNADVPALILLDAIQEQAKCDAPTRHVAPDGSQADAIVQTSSGMKPFPGASRSKPPLFPKPGASSHKEKAGYDHPHVAAAGKPSRPPKYRNPRELDDNESICLGEVVRKSFDPRPGDVMIVRERRQQRCKDNGYVCFYTKQHEKYNWCVGDFILRSGKFCGPNMWKVGKRCKLYQRTHDRHWMLVGLVDKPDRLLPLVMREQRVDAQSRSLVPRRGDFILRRGGLEGPSQLERWTFRTEINSGDILARVYVGDVGLRCDPKDAVEGQVELYVYGGRAITWIFVGRDVCRFRDGCDICASL